MIRALALALLICSSSYGKTFLPINQQRSSIEPRALDFEEPNSDPKPQPGGFLPIQLNQTQIQIEKKAYESKGCGHRNLNIISPAVRNSARQTNFAELPWTVMIFHSNNRLPIFKCGGSLIDESIVLTAAHCVYGLNVSHLSIRAGEWDTQSNAEPLPHQNRKVSNVSIHPDYVGEIYYNDLALLFLSEPVELAENVDVICLPEEDQFDDVNCLASGWGKDEFGDTGRYQVVLKSIELSIDPPKICQNILRTTRLGKHFTLHDSFICASGVDGADTCTGDGGGPLICPSKKDPSRYVQVGAVSWGIGCGKQHVPGVYASVLSGRKWIDDTIALYTFKPTETTDKSTFDSPIDQRFQAEVPQEISEIFTPQSIPEYHVPQQAPEQQQQHQVQPNPVVTQRPNQVVQSQAQVIVIHQNQPNFQQQQQQQAPKYVLTGHPQQYPGIPVAVFSPSTLEEQMKLLQLINNQKLIGQNVNQQPSMVVLPNYSRSNNKRAYEHCCRELTSQKHSYDSHTSIAQEWGGLLQACLKTRRLKVKPVLIITLSGRLEISYIILVKMIKTAVAALMLIGVVCSQNVNDTCVCVEYFQCNYNGQVNEDGEGIIDIRTGVVDENPFAARRQCSHYLEVCCLPPEIKPGNDVIQPGSNDRKKPTQKPTDRPVTGVKGPHVSKGCGYRNPNGIGFRITGAFNNEANFAEYPWTVAILRDERQGENNIRVYTCGGSLIHKRVVLTAAHCIEGREASLLTVRAGEWDTQTTNEPLPHQDRRVAVALTHPKFQKGPLFNNYALLILEKPVELADNIEVACLPDPREVFDFSKCIATGWGKDQFGKEGHYQVILKSVELPVVPRDSCENSLRGTRLGRYFKLDKSFICAGGENNVDTCTGDGGSPLVCPLKSDPTRYTQAGIVSWGIGCGTQGVPGVYADVTKAREWIDQTLAGYKIDTSSYSVEAGFDRRLGGGPVNQPIGV